MFHEPEAHINVIKIQATVLIEKYNSLPNIWVEQRRSYSFASPVLEAVV